MSAHIGSIPPFLLTLDQVVLVLHRDEQGPTVQVSGVLHLGELPGIHRRRAEIADLPRLDEVVQRLHRLLDRGVGVEAVDQVDIDVVSVEASQRGVDLLHDRRAGQAGAAGAVVHLPGDLRGYHDLLTAGVLLDRPSDELLRAARLVDVRRVPERDAQLHGLLEEPDLAQISVQRLRP